MKKCELSKKILIVNTFEIGDLLFSTWMSIFVIIFQKNLAIRKLMIVVKLISIKTNDI